MKSRQIERSRRPGRRNGALALALLLCGAAAFLPLPARAQLSWLNPEDGEILNVSSAEGPSPGHPFIQVRRSLERSSVRGQVLINRLRVQYGINRFASIGVSGVHLHQRYGVYDKRGLGDTDVSLKLYFRPSENLPLRFGLRQSLSIPTGYERERDGLAPFTSRQNDYSAQGLIQYVNPRFSGYLNPGVILPGGPGNTLMTGGFGLAFGLPFGCDLRGEYYTRWDMVDHRGTTEIYGGMRTPDFHGLSMQFGVKRRLLQNEKVDPEMQFGLCYGRDRTPDSEAYSVPVPRQPTGLLIHPIECLVPDPAGVAKSLTETFRTENGRETSGLALFLRTYPSEHADLMFNMRHYELNLKILQIDQGSAAGNDLSPLLRWNRASAEIVAQAELIAPDGYTVVVRGIYRGTAKKSLGLDVAPDHSSSEAVVTPDEVKETLRAAAVRDLAAKILRDVSLVVKEREQS